LHAGTYIKKNKDP